mmetsp:Transcript_7873/g.15234  ORF Transcript_7873/g.15234 Transcript_7873/m.15234 type:complete len:404 (+) Transcript_7873:8004-9215(+)
MADYKNIGEMQSDYDKTRWFELLRQGDSEQISNELSHMPKSFLVNLVDNSSSRHTAIFYAVQLPDEAKGNALLELLLHYGADVTYKDSLQQAAIFYAAKNGHRRQTEILLQAGTQPNDKDTYGQTALYYAAREGSVNVIETLLSFQADINAVDNLGQTAIFYACREGKLDACKALVANGAVINQTDRTRHTPLTWAKRSNNQGVIDFLMANGAVDKTSKKKEEPRRKDDRRKPEKKLKCQLMVVDEFGEKRPVTERELAEFEERHPHLAKYWKNPESLSELDTLDPDTIENTKPWEKPAKKLISAIWRAPHAWIFHEPVDPIKLNIPDYFEIVKNPMDLGTIKKKLNNNAYESLDRFIGDVEQVFTNCRLYNPPESDVMFMCNQVAAAFAQQVKLLGLDKYTS